MAQGPQRDALRLDHGRPTTTLLVGEQGLRAFGPSFTARSEDLSRFFARVLIKAAGGMPVTFIEAAHVSVKQATDDSAPANQALLLRLHFVLAGAVIIEQRATRHKVTKNELAITSVGDSFSVDFDGKAHIACLRLPYAAITDNACESAPLLPIAVGLTCTGCVTRQALIAMHQSTTSPTARVRDGHVGLAVKELGLASMSEAMPAPPLPCDGRQALLTRALQLIQEDPARSNLGTAWIATQLGVSRRYLDQVFQSCDDTVTTMVRRERVMLACEYMAADDSLPIESIARRSGFGSPVSLRRAFTAHLGMSPSAFRHTLAVSEPRTHRGQGCRP